METYMMILIVVMLLAGCLGGLVNYFLAQKDDPASSNIWRSLVVGIVASLMVPLFLNMISSNLIDSIRGNSNSPGDISKVLVFAGFCLVAAISSTAFIRTLSDRILKEAQTAKKEAQEAKEDVVKVKAEVEPIVAKQTEKEPTPEKAAALAGTNGIGEKEKNILKSFADSKFALRTLSGIAQDTKIDRIELENILSNLEANNLIGKRMGKNGIRWYITQDGLDAIAS